MPIYEYLCPGCESKFELLRPMSRANEGVSCPHCQQEAERILSTFACFSMNESGLSFPVGGSSCASCGAGSCTTCNM